MSARPWDFGWSQIICDGCDLSLWHIGRRASPPNWIQVSIPTQDQVGAAPAVERDYDFCPDCAATVQQSFNVAEKR